MATHIRRGARPHLYIAEWMESRGLSDETLANRLGVDRSTIFRWRTARRQVKPEVQEALAKGLDLDAPEDLWRPPDTRVSIDAIARELPDDLYGNLVDIARSLKKRAS